MSENQAQAEVIKPKRGGKRAGAGRPSIESKLLKDTAYLSARGYNPLTAAMILQHVIDERKTWLRILTSTDDRVVLQAMVYLSSMRDGKPAQQINVTSTTLHVRPDDIARARQIVREIRLDNGARLAIAEQPTTADADSMTIACRQPRLGEGEQKANGSIMLSGAEGGKKDGEMGVESGIVPK